VTPTEPHQLAHRDSRLLLIEPCQPPSAALPPDLAQCSEGGPTSGGRPRRPTTPPRSGSRLGACSGPDLAGWNPSRSAAPGTARHQRIAGPQVSPYNPIVAGIGRHKLAASGTPKQRTLNPLAHRGAAHAHRRIAFIVLIHVVTRIASCRCRATASSSGRSCLRVLPRVLIA
jgi:hypothetical protein